MYVHINQLRQFKQIILKIVGKSLKWFIIGQPQFSQIVDSLQRWCRRIRGGADCLEVAELFRDGAEWLRGGADGLEVLQTIKRRCRWFRGGADLKTF